MMKEKLFFTFLKKINQENKAITRKQEIKLLKLEKKKSTGMFADEPECDFNDSPHLSLMKKAPLNEIECLNEHFLFP